MELMASGAALIVIDMQNSFCSDAGGCDKAGLPVENLKVAIEPCGRPADGDHVVDKNRPSAFYTPAFETTLKDIGVESLVVCGATTNCCVESTVRDASQRDYKTFVVADAVAEFEEDRHRIALQSMGKLFADVVTIADVVAAWRA
jgi:nicotinamidase-related amidase